MLKDAIGPYVILEKAGEGAYGIVWKVQNEKDGHIYAIKEVSKKKITPQLLESLIREVQISFSISNENIVKCHNTLESKNNYYIIFEYCSGGDLGRYLRRAKRPDIKEALFIMRQIRDGYRYLLNQNILHRDIKLENILIKDIEEMTIKISDFGCSKADALGTTICGTPKYMALEVMDSDGNYNYKADFWSIGLVFWELLFGIDNFPFSQKSKEALKNDIKKYSGSNLRFPKYPVYPDVFYDFFKSMLNVSPQLRPDADEFCNHPIFNYDGTESDIINGFKGVINTNIGEINDIVVSNISLRDSIITNTGNDYKIENDASLKNFEDQSGQLMIFADIKKAYTLKILEVNLIKSVGTALFDFVQIDWNKEFFSNYTCLCIIILKKALIKAEITLKTLEKGVNTFQLPGFSQFIECPNDNILLKEELQNLTVSLKKIDDEIYAQLLDYCYSPIFLEQINQFFYLKAEVDGKTKFISTVWKFVFSEYKQYIPDYEYAKFEKNLQRTSIILKGKVAENLNLFY